MDLNGQQLKRATLDNQMVYQLGKMSIEENVVL